MSLNSEYEQPLLEKKSELPYFFETKRVRQSSPLLRSLMTTEELLGEVYRFLAVSDLMVMARISKDLAKYRKLYSENHITNEQLMAILECAAEHVELSLFLEKIALYLRYKLNNREISESLLQQIIVVDNKHPSSEDHKENGDQKTTSNRAMLKVLSPTDIKSLKRTVEGINGKCEPYCDNFERTFCLALIAIASYGALGACLGCSIGCCVNACIGAGCSCNTLPVTLGIEIGDALGASSGLCVTGGILYEESFRYLANNYLDRYKLFSSLVPGELKRYNQIAEEENLQLTVSPPPLQQPS